MTPAEVLASLHLRRVILAPSPDGSLRYHPKEALSVAERADLARHRKEILALLDADPVVAAREIGGDPALTRVHRRDGAHRRAYGGPVREMSAAPTPHQPRRP